jgi:C_GCAxxG_C_C family probable redox protein
VVRTVRPRLGDCVQTLILLIDNMTQPHITEAADARHREGHNCAQSTLSVFAEELGLPLDQAMRLAAPFGGGMGRRGEVCGAASGALLALGLRFGPPIPDKDGKERMYAITAEFLRRFEVRTGALHCRDLIQADTSTPEGLAEARERKVFDTICPSLIAAAVEIADELLHRRQ